MAVVAVPDRLFLEIDVSIEAIDGSIEEPVCSLEALVVIVEATACASEA